MFFQSFSDSQAEKFRRDAYHKQFQYFPSVVEESMIISASRRTDIPAFYSDWFINRLRKGFVYVRNPFNFRQISKVPLNAEAVDCIVFWTKNVLPMLTNLSAIDALGFPYYFQFTVTPYDETIERYVPAKQEIIAGFKCLSETIGKDRVIWRYDPVIVTENLSVAYHLEQFSALCQILRNYTERCIFSYIDVYAKQKCRPESVWITELQTKTMAAIAQGFSEIARSNQLILQICSEDMDVQSYHMSRAACIDGKIIEALTGYQLKQKKDPNQRANCRCLESVDIGMYDSCRHGCIYCYAVGNDLTARKNAAKHCVYSPLLFGRVEKGDHIIPRKISVMRSRQNSLFDS